ncbi:MAG: FAD-dependent oxidoreductase [Planctomycetes bacterium]|nr:FAD-dependent oxidoreductase [Planctomycetota bacterium]
MTTKPRVLVLGGGFGGLEALFYLKYQLGDRADLTLVSDEPKFFFKPNTIYIPFGQAPEKFEVDLSRPLKKQSIHFVNSTVESVDPDKHAVITRSGNLNYDYLVIATGAKMRSKEIPGLYEHAITVWTPDDMLRLRDRIAWAKERAAGNNRTRFVFLIPPNNRCSGPLYEMVMMLDTHLRQSGCRDLVDLVYATKEEAYIEAFGPRLNTVVADEFRTRNIEGHTGYVVTGIEPGMISFQNGEKLAYDVLVSFPPYVASTLFEQLPSTERGFIEVENDSRRVRGQDRIFAVGDAANFPIKQAFLALLQGDAAGDHVAAEILGKKPTVDFEPMSMCVMEELNKATFAQVPLKYTGDPDKPVAVDTEDTEHYHVGVSPIWRMGKTVLGLYLPWRFGNGKPFHAGFAWEAMDMGLKVMSKVFAR